MADILAHLEAQLEDWDDASDEDNSSEGYDTSSNNQLVSSDDEDEDDEEEEEEDSSDDDDDDDDESSSSDSSGEESEVTTDSQAAQRLEQVRMDASMKLQAEMKRLKDEEKDAEAQRQAQILPHLWYSREQLVHQQQQQQQQQHQTPSQQAPVTSVAPPTISSNTHSNTSSTSVVDQIFLEEELRQQEAAQKQAQEEEQAAREAIQRRRLERKNSSKKKLQQQEQQQQVETKPKAKLETNKANEKEATPHLRSSPNPPIDLPSNQLAERQTKSSNKELDSSEADVSSDSDSDSEEDSSSGSDLDDNDSNSSSDDDEDSSSSEEETSESDDSDNETDTETERELEGILQITKKPPVATRSPAAPALSRQSSSVERKSILSRQSSGVTTPFASSTAAPTTAAVIAAPYTASLQQHQGHASSTSMVLDGTNNSNNDYDPLEGSYISHDALESANSSCSSLGDDDLDFSGPSPPQRPPMPQGRLRSSNDANDDDDDDDSYSSRITDGPDAQQLSILKDHVTANNRDDDDDDSDMNSTIQTNNSSDSSSCLSHMSSPLSPSPNYQPFHHGRTPFSDSALAAAQNQSNIDDGIIPSASIALVDSSSRRHSKHLPELKRQQHKTKQAHHKKHGHQHYYFLGMMIPEDCQERIAGVFLVLTGVAILCGLLYTAHTRQGERDPYLKFQSHATAALDDVATRIGSLEEALWGMKQQIQQRVHDTNQSWPFVTLPLDSDWDHHQNEDDDFLNQDICFIVAPLVSPRHWGAYEKYQLHQTAEVSYLQNDVASLLQWDPFYEPPDEAIFVPWQKILSGTKQETESNLHHILFDWYMAPGSSEQESDIDVWEQLLSTTESSFSHSVPLMRRDNETHHDYFFLPLMASVVTKRRLFRPDDLEVQVVAVVALQWKLDQALQKTLQSSFAKLEDMSRENGIDLVATVDYAHGSTVRYPIAISPSSGEGSGMAPLQQTGIKEQYQSFYSMKDSWDPIVREITFGASSLNNDFCGSSGGDVVSECKQRTVLKIKLHATHQLEQALREVDWKPLELCLFWMILYAYICWIVVFSIQDNKVRSEVESQFEDEMRALEELDPEEALSSATVVVMDITGWEEWTAGRDPCEIQSFLTSLMHAMDHVAARHRVVKINTVGSALEYAKGGPTDHVVDVTRFTGECMASMPRWMNQLSKTYGPKTKEALKFSAGLCTGALDAGQAPCKLLISQVSGLTLRKAQDLEAIRDAGNVCVSNHMAKVLKRYGRENWLLDSEHLERGEQVFLLDNEAVKKLGEVRQRRRSLGSTTQAVANIADSRSRAGMDRSTRSIRSRAHLADVRCDSPPPLSKMGETGNGNEDHLPQTRSSKRGDYPPPPIAQISVATAAPPPIVEIEAMENVDLGYEQVEPQTFDNNSDHASVKSKNLANQIAEKKERLVDWSVDILTQCLEENLAARTANNPKKALGAVEDQLGKGSNILEQCKESIAIPIFSQSELRERHDRGHVPLTDAASTQLRDYISKIAASYQDHVFHNFEHASNVMASMRKFYNKLVGNEFGRRKSERNLGGLMKDNSGRSLFSTISVGHSTSFGITTDPLIKFTILLCALIHDVEHTGLTNEDLIKQNSPMAVVYKKRSIAEQNSVEFSWSLLMRPEYVDLRSAIYCNERELRRFRQIIVNCVLATDLHDEELQLARRSRWALAFTDDKTSAAPAKKDNKSVRRAKSLRNKKDDNDRARVPATKSGGSMLDALRRAATSVATTPSRPKDDMNRKGTLLLEYLLQAADICHTMQNWKIFLKWNERLFDERYEAFEAGRSDVDPSVDWYQGELAFFDTVVIPLAMKLVNSGVLGESAEELLENAYINREEWEVQGEEIMELYMAHYQESHECAAARGDDSSSSSSSSSSIDDDMSFAEDGLDDKIENSNDEPIDLGVQKKSLSRSNSVVSKSSHSSGGRSDEKRDEEQNKKENGENRISAEDEVSAPSLALGSVSLSGTIEESDDGSAPDADVVYAVLENTDEPDDFDSYILLTPSQKRKNDAKKAAAAQEKKTARRRMRRTYSTASGGRRKSMASSRRSMSTISIESNPDSFSGSQNLRRLATTEY